FFPSTKMCSDCGRINDKMALNVRAWNCPCGSAHDRDVNAAMNVLAAGRAESLKRPWSAGKTTSDGGTARRSGNPPGRRVFHAQRGGNLRPLGRRDRQCPSPHSTHVLDRLDSLHELSRHDVAGDVHGDFDP
ncbi:transposase, partial [Micromonospora sp. ATA32]|nr:transposase [Micromonospora sp. ATA32]